MEISIRDPVGIQAASVSVEGEGVVFPSYEGREEEDGTAGTGRAESLSQGVGVVNDDVCLGDSNLIPRDRLDGVVKKNSRVGVEGYDPISYLKSA